MEEQRKKSRKKGVSVETAQHSKKKVNRRGRKSKKAAKNRRLIITAAIVLCVLLAGVITTLVLKEKGILFGSDKVEGLHELSEGEDLESVKIEVKSSEDYVEPASGTLAIDKIQGFVGNVTGTAANSDDKTTEEGGSGVTLSDSNLKVESIGRYSGNFLEDGSDESIANVAAMLITNNSDQMLQIAEITFKVNETETANFKVTDLPAGTSTLVLEANKREFKEEDSYTYGETATGYMEQPSLEEDKFELITEKGKITLKNKTNESYDKVYVYYKYVQLGGAYLGGITYRTPFENVPAGGEVEAIAAHFNPESSKIMAVQIQE